MNTQAGRAGCGPGRPPVQPLQEYGSASEAYRNSSGNTATDAANNTEQPLTAIGHSVCSCRIKTSPCTHSHERAGG
jgi:hypothetical protein